MAWQKSSPGLIETFQAVVPNLPEVERRQMFGYPCAFVNGNMFTGLHQEDMILRLDESDRTVLTAMPGGGIFEPMAGRKMREYAKVPPAILADRQALGEWVGRSYAFVVAMPPKVKKPRKAKKKKA